MTAPGPAPTTAGDRRPGFSGRRTPPGGPNGCCAGTRGPGGTGTARSSPNCWCPTSRSARTRPAAPSTSRAAASSPGCRRRPVRRPAARLGRRPRRGRGRTPAVGRHVTASLVSLGCCLCGCARLRRRDVVPADHRLAVVRGPAGSASAAAFATRDARRSRCRSCSPSRSWPRCRCSPRVGRRIAGGRAGRPAPAVGGPGRGQRDRVRRRQALRERLARHRRPRRLHPGRGGRVRVGDVAVGLVVLGASRAAGQPCPPPRSPGWPSARWPRRSAVASAAVVVRRARLSPRVLAFETRLAAAACAAMAVCWPAARAGWRPADRPVASRRRSAGLFHAGLIDVAGIAVLAVALAVAVQAARTARRGLPWRAVNASGSASDAGHGRRVRLLPQTTVEVELVQRSGGASSATVWSGRRPPRRPASAAPS